MSLFPTVYRSTDPGAPALTGQAGSLAALLDAILVDGYGVGSEAKPGLGWTREFMAVNKRAYRNSPVSGSGYFLRIDDSNAQFGLLRGFEQMSNVDEGVNGVPTAAQLANGSLWIKSNLASSAARVWFAIGTERCFYLFVQHTDQGSGYAVVYFAGDLVSYVPGDRHCFAISQNAQTGYTTGFSFSVTLKSLGTSWSASPTTSTAGLYVARSYKGATGAVLLGLANMVNNGFSAGIGARIGNASYDMPAPVNGGVISLPAMIQEDSLLMRAEFPGLRWPLASTAYGDDLLVDDRLLFKRFRATSGLSNSTSYPGEVLFELDKEWG